MELPRVRVTVRRMMIAVAIDLALWFPSGPGVLWSYSQSLSCSASILYRHVPSNAADQANPASPTSTLGHPVPQQATYSCTTGESIPAGFPYRITLEVKITDPTFVTVYQIYLETHYAITHVGWSERGCAGLSTAS